MALLYNSFNAFSEEHTLTNFKQVVSNGIASIWKENLLNDVIIMTSDEQEFPCHRLLLASTSCYFRAMFTSGLQESRNGVVKFSTVDSNSLRIILNFLYTGSLTISNDTVFKLLETADFLQIQSIIDLCISELKNHVTKETCTDLLLFSLRSNSFSALKEFTFQVLLDNFKDFVNTEQFGLLPTETIFELLRSSKLRVNSEEMVFEAIVFWAYTDPKRLRDVFELLQNVQFEAMNQKYIEDIVVPQINMIDNESDTDSNSPSRMVTVKRVANAQQSLNTHTLKRQQFIDCDACIRARLRRENIIVFVASEDDMATAFRLDFKDHYRDIALNAIDTIDTCPQEIVKCRNRPIVIGEDVMIHSRGRLVMYNLKDQQIKTVRNPPEVQVRRTLTHYPNTWARTRGSSCAELNGGLYCVGGQRGYMNQCLCYDPNLDEWKVCEGFNHPSTNPSLVSGRDVLYVVRQENTGFLNRDSQTEVTLVGYSPVKDEMTPEVSFTVDGDPDSSSQMTIHENFIYLGHNGTLTKVDTVSKEYKNIGFDGEVLFVSPEVCEGKVYAVVVKNRRAPVLELYVEETTDGQTTTWTLLLQQHLRSFRSAVSVTVPSQQ